MKLFLILCLLFSSCSAGKLVTCSQTHVVTEIKHDGKYLLIKAEPRSNAIPLLNTTYKVGDTMALWVNKRIR